MTTREQFIQESIKKHPRFADRRVGFIDGAEYGYNLAVEKVYGRLNSIDFEQRYLDSENLFNKEQFIDDLKQEMML